MFCFWGISGGQRVVQMLQQTKIVIDFQEIFNNSQHSHDFSFPENQSPDPEFEIKQDFTEPLPDLPSKHLQPNYSLIALTSATSNRLFKSPLPATCSFESESNSRLLSTTALIARKKSSSPQRVRSITSRLTQVKKECTKPLKKGENEVICEKKEEKPAHIKLTNSSPQKQQKRQPRAPSSKSSAVIRSHSCSVNIFERLHFHSKISAIEQRYRVGPEVVERRKQSLKKSEHNEQYLKTYVPFYSRLQSEVNRSFEKMEMYEQMSGWAQGRKPFTPQMRPTKYSNKVKSRYMEGSKVSIKYVDLDCNSQNSSFESLHKSDRMMALMEQHFMNKMQCIFLEEGEENVKITEKKIRLLTEVEFQILEVFIRYFDQNTIPASEFHHYLQSYFHSLTTADKLKLRSHQLQMKYKYPPLSKESQKRKATVKLPEKRVDKTQSRILQKGELYHASTYQFI